MTRSPESYFVREQDVPGYSPKGHGGTLNRRLVGAENVGARNLEVVLGEIQPGEGAPEHLHPGIEQVCYMLAGRARASIGSLTRELGPGDTVFFPADEMHSFTAIGDVPVRLLVIYGPPYAEGPRIDR